MEKKIYEKPVMQVCLLKVQNPLLTISDTRGILQWSDEPGTSDR